VVRTARTSDSRAIHREAAARAKARKDRQAAWSARQNAKRERNRERAKRRNRKDSASEDEELSDFFEDEEDEEEEEEEEGENPAQASPEFMAALEATSAAPASSSRGASTSARAASPSLPPPSAVVAASSSSSHPASATPSLPPPPTGVPPLAPSPSLLTATIPLPPPPAGISPPTPSPSPIATVTESGAPSVLASALALPAQGPTPSGHEGTSSAPPLGVGVRSPSEDVRTEGPQPSSPSHRSTSPSAPPSVDRGASDAPRPVVASQASLAPKVGEKRPASPSSPSPDAPLTRRPRRARTYDFFLLGRFLHLLVNFLPSTFCVCSSVPASIPAAPKKSLRSAGSEVPTRLKKIPSGASPVAGSGALGKRPGPLLSTAGAPLASSSPSDSSAALAAAVPSCALPASPGLDPSAAGSASPTTAVATSSPRVLPAPEGAPSAAPATVVSPSAASALAVVPADDEDDVVEISRPTLPGDVALTPSSSAPEGNRTLAESSMGALAVGELETRAHPFGPSTQAVPGEVVVDRTLFSVVSVEAHSPNEVGVGRIRWLNREDPSQVLFELDDQAEWEAFHNLEAGCNELERVARQVIAPAARVRSRHPW